MKKEKKDEKLVTMESVEQALLEQLDQLDPTSDEYKAVLQHLVALKEADAKATEAEAKAKPKVTPDTWIKAGATIGSTLLLLAYERNNPITSKLLSFIPKPKL